jgi:hypothetical protein
MSSISSITQQYAKQQQMKKAQKGGAMFDFLKGDDDSKKAEASAETSSTAVPQPTEEKGAIDKLKETLGIGTPTTPAAPDTKDEVQNEGTEEKPGLLSGIFGTGESKKDDEGEDRSEASEDGSEASEASEASEDGSEASEASEDGSDDNDDDFDMISQKMNALREKYEKLKSDHNAMKNKMESEKAEEKKADNQKVSTLIAAFTASQGALTAFKEALIDHLKNNNYPLDGLELDTSSFNQAPAAAAAPEEEAPSAAPEEEAPSAAPEEEAPAAAPEEEAPSAAPEEEAPAAAPEEEAPAAAPEEEAPAAEVVDNEQQNSEPSEDVNENTETSMLESGSKSPDNQNEGDQTVSSALPEIPVNEVPENSVDDNTSAAPVSDSTSINGGRSHYVHSTNKKATTHRHHKRRNRHQTLRGYKK